MTVENVNDYLNGLLSNASSITSSLRNDAQNIAKHVMSMVAEKDARFQSSVIGTGSCFEETLVISTDFDFDFIISLEICTKFVVEEFLAKCGFVQLKFIDGAFSEKELMCLVDGGRALNDSSKKDWTRKGLFAELVQDVLPNVNLPLGWIFNKTQTTPQVKDNGPAVTIYLLNEDVETGLKRNVSIDLVLAIRLKYLPSQVDLPHRLPKEHPLYMQLIHLIKTSTYYLVLKRISFRISFSIMEIKLFETFPFLRDVYKIVKTLRNMFLKDSQGNKWLSSYELKTAVFFELECFPDPAMWNKNHSIDRVRNIFAFILDALFRSDMPHFFISHKNIFDSDYRWFIQGFNDPIGYCENNTRNTSKSSNQLTSGHNPDKRFHFVMKLFFNLSKEKWDCQQNVEIVRNAQSDTLDDESSCFGKDDFSTMQLEISYRNSFKMLRDIISWKTLQIELLRRHCIGKLHREKMVKIMINRSTGAQSLGYLKYDFVPSRWIAHNNQFILGKVFKFPLHFMPTLQVNKDVIDKVSLGLPSVLSAIPRPSPTKIQDLDFEMRAFDKRNSNGPDIAYVTRIDTSYYWSHFVHWKEKEGIIVASDEAMASIPVMYYN